VSLLTPTARGVFAIAPTPFYEDGRIDLKSLRRLAEFYTQVGVDGLTLLGQMGEAPKLTHAESVEIFRTVRDSTDLPLVVGVSAPGFGSMKALSDEVMTLGAAGVMIAPPNTLRSDDQIVSYYTAASSAIGSKVPIVVQDYPLTFSVEMSAGVITRIAAEVPAVAMIKHEDWPGLEKISAIRDAEARGEIRRLSILCGNGGLFLDFETERGGDGAMTGYCFPELLVKVIRLINEGRRDEAHDAFDSHLPLIRYEQQPGTGLAVRKHVMVRRRLLESDFQRAPGRRLSSTERAEVDYLLQRLGRHDPLAHLD
jgi:4-hydroxy-tetrahydrodipicolinate synthase